MSTREIDYDAINAAVNLDVIQGYYEELTMLLQDVGIFDALLQLLFGSCSVGKGDERELQDYDLIMRTEDGKWRAFSRHFHEYLERKWEEQKNVPINESTDITNQTSLGHDIEQGLNNLISKTAGADVINKMEIRELIRSTLDKNIDSRNNILSTLSEIPAKWSDSRLIDSGNVYEMMVSYGIWITTENALRLEIQESLDEGQIEQLKNTRKDIHVEATKNKSKHEEINLGGSQEFEKNLLHFTSTGHLFQILLDASLWNACFGSTFGDTQKMWQFRTQEILQIRHKMAHSHALDMSEHHVFRGYCQAILERISNYHANNSNDDQIRSESRTSALVSQPEELSDAHCNVKDLHSTQGEAMVDEATVTQTKSTFSNEANQNPEAQLDKTDGVPHTKYEEQIQDEQESSSNDDDEFQGTVKWVNECCWIKPDNLHVDKIKEGLPDTNSRYHDDGVRVFGDSPRTLDGDPLVNDQKVKFKIKPDYDPDNVVFSVIAIDVKIENQHKDEAKSSYETANTTVIPTAHPSDQLHAKTKESSKANDNQNEFQGYVNWVIKPSGADLRIKPCEPDRTKDTRDYTRRIPSRLRDYRASEKTYR